MVSLDHLPSGGDFEAALGTQGGVAFTTGRIEIFQINLGKLCNMTCRHCHVDAGPDRWREVMSRETVDACLAALDRTDAHTVDLTGGAPELNPNFRYLVDQCVARGKHVIDRCNLTVLLLQRYSDLPEFFANRQVEVVCSLPHFRRRNTDAQRGDGTFEKSIKALERLNAAGYGSADPSRVLTLMVNPVGALLTGDQCSMEREWKRGLDRNHGVSFDRLTALNNMPISRFLEWLEASDNLEGYMELLVNAFNPGTVQGLMCRNTLSVSWDGRVYDCDFNQMLGLESRCLEGQPMPIGDFDPARMVGRKIVTGRHCFGCTAGAGSSCGGAIHDTSD
ncbi:MAG: arsenosugar biosynthesis radical SAM protein ArsS [Acidobacteria bacterium]|nr:arsenosugar biosynthesis radical SAM protein ArsS [Candidatus Sulfomarinibacter kjeldsenii]